MMIMAQSGSRTAFSLIIFILTCSAWAVAAHADQNFENEVDFGFSSLESKQKNNEKDAFELNIRHYFSPIEGNNMPYNEANFFSRSSFLSFGLQESDNERITQTPTSSSLNNTDQTAYSVVGTIARPYLPYIFSAGYTYSQLEEKSAEGTTKENKDRFSLSAGYYLKQNLLLSVQYSKSDLEDTLTELNTRTGINNSYMAQIRWYNPLTGGKGLSLTPRFEYEKAEDDAVNAYTRTTGLDAQLYFDRATNIGFDYRRSISDLKSTEGDTLTTSFKRFITPRFSIGVSYRQFFTDEIDFDDSEQFSFSATSRF